MAKAFEKTFGKVRPVHPHQWLWEPLESEPSFVLRTMFGAKAVYIDGRLMLCFCAGEEPWHGLLVCTDRERQASLQADFPGLTPHSVLPKWLYLPESADTFERAAPRLVALALRRDPRLGVAPRPRKKRAKAAGIRPRP
ncbi:MAG: hypothetical protein ABUL68_01410 [Pseudomonadota bacterium]